MPNRVRGDIASKSQAEKVSAKQRQEIRKHRQAAEDTAATALAAHVAAVDPHTGYRLESADHTHQSTGAEAGQLDHGLALTGLTDDDHTNYYTVAGRDGDDLVIRSAAGTDYVTFSNDGNQIDVDVTSISQFIWHTPMYVYPSTGSANQALVQVDANGNSNGAKVRVRSTGTGSSADAYYDIWGPTKQYSFGMDNSDSDYFVFSYGSTLGTNNVFEITSATAFDIVNGTTLSIFDSTNTDSVAISHDGTDLNIVATTTTDINITGAKLVTVATTTTQASVNLPHGTAPTSPVDGDMWTTTAGLYVRINGSTVGPLS